MTFTQGISELVLVVQDVSKVKRFYEDIVGLVLEKDGGDGYAWFWTGLPEQSQRIGLLKGPLAYETHSPLPEGQRWGCVHYAFQVSRDKLEAAVSHVRAHGVTIYGPEYIRWMSAQVYYFYDPEGNLLEFWSPESSNES